MPNLQELAAQLRAKMEEQKKLQIEIDGLANEFNSAAAGRSAAEIAAAVVGAGDISPRGSSNQVSSKRSAPKGSRPEPITDEKKAKLKEMVLAGKTSQEIAQTLGISKQSVHNIKKAFGLVKPKAKVNANTPAAATSSA